MAYKALRIKALAPNAPYGSNDETMPILCRNHAFLVRLELDLGGFATLEETRV